MPPASAPSICPRHLPHASAPGTCPKDVTPGTRRAKKVKSGRHRSALADGSFIEVLRVFGRFDRCKRGRTLVGIAAPLPLSLPTCNPEKLLTPRKWRDTGEDIRGLFFHEALRDYARAKGLTYRAYTLRLGKEVEAAARAQGPQCLDYLRHRFALELKNALEPRQGEYMAWWFAIEEDDKGALHIHGEIAFREIDRRRLRKALCKAGGKWVVPPPVMIGGRKRQSNRQLRFCRKEPDHGWAGYSLKNTRKAGSGRRRLMEHYGNPRRWTAQFEGKAVTTTDVVKTAATAIHKQAVADVKASRPTPKSIST